MTIVSLCSNRAPQDRFQPVTKTNAEGPTMTMNSTSEAEESSPIGLGDLAAWFTPKQANNLIGLEVEYGLVHTATGTTVDYAGPNGSQMLLEKLAQCLDAKPIYEGKSIIGVSLSDRSTLTLEMGNAIELSLVPLQSLDAALRQAKQWLREVARAAEPMGLSVLSGGRLPFEDSRHIRWAPKPRTEIMRRHFRHLGDGGALGDHVMGLTLSMQTSFDAASEDDYLSKLRALLVVSALISPLLLNTPSLGDKPSDRSLRMMYWRQIDPARCQDLTHRLFAVADFKELARVLAGLPMIYRKTGDGYVPGDSNTFERCVEHGFSDGTFPTINDWTLHLGQVWPSVRPRRTLETRLPDGQSWDSFDTLPAMFTALTEDRPSRHRLLELAASLDPQFLDALAINAARSGLSAVLNDEIRELLTHILDLVESGLTRVAPSLAGATDSPREALATGLAPADRLLEQWQGAWKRDPARYVAAMAVPTTD